MSESHDHLIHQLAKKLTDNKWSLATAESCTGGGLSTVLTSISGTSAWFERGFITYSNQSKLDLLDVSQSILDKQGAVSKECALAMATGGLRNSKADLCISITGIAGPDGGTPDKPVGTVWIAIAAKSNQPYAKVYHFDGDRQAVREQTIDAALTMLIKQLQIAPSSPSN